MLLKVSMGSTIPIIHIDINKMEPGGGGGWGWIQGVGPCCWRVDLKGWGGIEKVAISDVRNCFRCRTEHIWGFYPPHRQYQINTQEGCCVRWKGGHNVCKGAYVCRAQKAPVEGVGNIPLGEPHRATRKIRLLDIL